MATSRNKAQSDKRARSPKQPAPSKSAPSKSTPSKHASDASAADASASKRGTRRLPKLDARRDTIDFRDKMYVPTLVEVPVAMPVERYIKALGGKVPVLDQGEEGACTGFGLAAVANYLLRTRSNVPDSKLVSPRMFYELARRYDEWEGEGYEGSSARGAMKGWHKHGVCTEGAWPFDPKDKGDRAGVLDHARAIDAALRPLGAYFRVNHQELAAMHCALAEVGILYATSTVHEGWSEVDRKTGVIPGPDGKRVLGGHAFAIVGYDDRGFWIQNSWGPKWGHNGFALVSYDDWLLHGSDVWVARLGAPTGFLVDDDARRPAIASARAAYAFADLRPHIINLKNNGELKPTGTFSTTEQDVRNIFAQDIPRLTQGWPTKRVLLYAHGGLVGADSALERVEETRRPLLDAKVYPLAFIWRTDALSTLTNILKEAVSRRRPEGFLDSAKDFMLDRLDDTLEPIARPLGKAFWDEMKENARLATLRQDGKGGARLVIDQLQASIAASPKTEIHITAHSAGSIFMAPVIERLAALGIPIHSVTLWAPACTVALFKSAYVPAIRSGLIKRFALFTLKDQAERDDHCAHIYNKSLLYLVSNAFEEKSGLLWNEGEAILGMEKFIFEDSAFKVSRKQVLEQNPHKVPILGLANAEWVRSPNGLQCGKPDASYARSHGAFDNDEATVRATLARILDRASSKADMDFRPSTAALGARRQAISTGDATLNRAR